MNRNTDDFKLSELVSKECVVVKLLLKNKKQHEKNATKKTKVALTEWHVLKAASTLRVKVLSC